MTLEGWALVALAATGAPLVLRTLRKVAQGNWATDVIASLAILTALALREPWAGLVVVAMQAGGEALERYAAGRASRAVADLEAAVPARVHRFTEGGVDDVPTDLVRPGDRLLVRPGEFIPCDGLVEAGQSHVDVSRLTGEALPRHAAAGTRLSSGAVNGEGALTLLVERPSRESQYAQIVELVRNAQASKAPLQRLADRMAAWFTPLAVGVATAAWLTSGDRVRALAVLVVATPCPLILAAPVAFIGGIGQAARRGVVVRHGAALERLADADAIVFDKTGTLTVGRPDVDAVTPVPPFDQDALLRLAAAVEQGSSHPLARSTVAEALARGLGPLPPAHDVTEVAGRGVSGRVDGRSVSLGAPGWLREREPGAVLGLPVAPNGGVEAGVVIDGRPAGTIRYADRLRPEAAQVVARLARLGLRRQVLLSGDSTANARAVGAALGIADARGDLLPADKVAAVAALTREGHRVVMVGDGTNDAPALSTAAVGIALAARGGGITAEAADVVLLADGLDRVADAVQLAQRTMRIARESLWIGLGASSAAMGVAFAGHLPPTAGALVQEAIDVVAILYALRASRGDMNAPS